MFRLYLDEVGTDGLTHVDQDKHRFLSLTGIAMRCSHASEFLLPEMNSIKWDLFRSDPDDPVVFHRSDILGGKGPFERLRKDEELREKFDQRALSIISECEYSVITALIDKQWMLEQHHWSKTHPYHYLMEIMVEKYARFLERQDDIGDIMPEFRQSNDKLLQKTFTEIKRNGTHFVSSERICSAIRAEKLKFRTKRDKICGLELCDLLAHPSHMYIRHSLEHEVALGPFTHEISGILKETKYDRSPYNGKITGYGIKHLP